MTPISAMKPMMKPSRTTRLLGNEKWAKTKRQRFGLPWQQLATVQAGRGGI
jgi:hypothetical protein